MNREPSPEVMEYTLRFARSPKGCLALQAVGILTMAIVYVLASPLTFFLGIAGALVGLVARPGWTLVSFALGTLIVSIGMTSDIGVSHLFVSFLGVCILCWAIAAALASRTDVSSRPGRRAMGLCFCCVIVAPAIWMANQFVYARTTASYSSDKSRLSQLANAIRLYAEDYDGIYPQEMNWGRSLHPYLSSVVYGPHDDPAKRPEQRDEGAPYPKGDYVYIRPKPDCDPDYTVVLRAPGWEDRIGLEPLAYLSGRTEERQVWAWWKRVWEGR